MNAYSKFRLNIISKNDRHYIIKIKDDNLFKTKD